LVAGAGAGEAAPRAQPVFDYFLSSWHAMGQVPPLWENAPTSMHTPVPGQHLFYYLKSNTDRLRIPSDIVNVTFV